jgi:stringent starvation protein B
MADAVPAMTSHRPYLLRALYEWIVDNGLTPHVLVDAGMPGVRVPAHAVKDGRIVLNIAERAVGGLRMDNESLRFSARFGGVSQSVLVPIEAVVAIYARENGQGMALPDDPRTPPASDEAGEAGAPDEAAGDSPAAPARPTLQAVESTPQDGDPGDQDGDDDGPAADPPKRGGHLRIVK